MMDAGFSAPDPRQTAAVAAGAWFASLPEALQRWMVANAQPRTLHAAQRLFARGDAPDGLHCVVRGTLRVIGIAESGREAVLALVEPPQWFGEIALFDRAARTYDVWAETDATVWRVPLPALERLLGDDPSHWRHFGRLLTQKLRLAFEMMEDSVLLAPTGRVARRLASIAGGYGAWPDRSRRVIAISQEQLGLLLSLSRQTVNQALRDLESIGAIRRSRGSIEIVDLAALRNHP